MSNIYTVEKDTSNRKGGKEKRKTMDDDKEKGHKEGKVRQLSGGEWWSRH